MKIGDQTLIVTNEHGSWAVLFVPMFTGIISSKFISIEIIPFFFLTLFAFMLYTPAEILYHEWKSGRTKNHKFKDAFSSFIIYGIFAGGFLTYEILFKQKYLLLIFAAAALFVFAINVKIKSSGAYSVLREFLGVIILTSTAPLAVYIMESRIPDDAIVLWFLNVLFFFSGTCYVNFLIEKLSKQKGKNIKTGIFSSKNIHIVYHLALSIFLVFFIIAFPSQYFKVIAFIPMITHVFAIYFSGKSVTDFKRVGLTLLGYSLFFAFFISIS